MSEQINSEQINSEQINSEQINSEQIKAEYKSMMFKAKIMLVLLVIMITPRLLITFLRVEPFFSLSEYFWRMVFMVGMILFAIFFRFFWKCPNCKKFPGIGYPQKKCDKCNVELS